MSLVATAVKRSCGSDADAEMLFYKRLWRLAASKLRYASPGATLSATALVNETFLKLSTAKSTADSNLWRDENRFLALAAEAMKQIIVDYHRRRSRQKRGGGFKRNRLELDALPDQASGFDILAISESLEQFERLHPDKAILVKLRFFGGMTMPECAQILGISVPTAERNWRYARAWLADFMRNEELGRTAANS